MMPKTIRRTPAKENDFGPDPALSLPNGAHLRIKNAKIFDAKFNEDTGDLWGTTVSLRLLVVDDRTEDGDADDEEFFDRFDLKFDEEVAEEFDIGPEDGAKNKNGKTPSLDEFLKTANKRDFTKAQQEALLDEDNWTIRGGTKLDKLMNCLYGQSWETFDPDDLEGKEFIAVVHPRTGKKSGSYCGWESFISLESPKKKKKKSSIAAAQEEVRQIENEIEQDLGEAEERAMHKALSDV
jgi:hypothetical protein